MQNFFINGFRYPILKLEIGIWFLDIRQSIDIHVFLDLMMSDSGLLMDSNDFNVACEVLNFDYHKANTNI